MNKLAIISAFLGKVGNRYMVYQDQRPLEQRVGMAARVEGADGLELCYPADFADVSSLKTLLADNNLGVSAVNFRARRTGRWLRGSFSAESEQERREVADDLTRAMDLAAEFGCRRVTTCPLNDGSDYVFEADYSRMYDNALGVFSRVCEHNREVKVCIEYKNSDPMARCLFASAADVTTFALLSGAPNLGATLDIGHSLLAGERPAQAASLLARAGRLFYVHLNDNDGAWDWDMLPGAYHFWETIELLYTLRRLNYDSDWFAFDVFPKEIDTVENYTAAMQITRKLEAIVDRIDTATLEELKAMRDPSKVVPYLYSLL